MGEDALVSEDYNTLFGEGGASRAVLGPVREASKKRGAVLGSEEGLSIFRVRTLFLHTLTPGYFTQLSLSNVVLLMIDL